MAPRFIDLMFGDQTFARMVRRVAHRAAPCIAGSVSGVLVDRIEAGTPTFSREAASLRLNLLNGDTAGALGVEGHRVVVNVPLKIFAVPETTVRERVVTSSSGEYDNESGYLVLHITAAFSVGGRVREIEEMEYNVTTIRRVARLVIDFLPDRSDLSSLPEEARTLLQDVLAGASSFVDLPMGQLSALLGGTLDPLNVGVALYRKPADATVGTPDEIVVRLQLRGGEPPPRLWWTSFFAAPHGRIPDALAHTTPGLQSNRWAVTLGGALLEELIEKSVRDALASRADGKQFAISQGPDARWFGSTSQVKTHVEVTAIGACASVDHDIRSDVGLTFSFFDVEDNELHVHTLGELDLNGADVAFCGAANAALAGGIGATIGTFIGGPLGGVIGGVVGSLAGFVGTAVAAGEEAMFPELPSLDALDCDFAFTDDDQDAFSGTCKVPLPRVQDAALGSLTIAGVQGEARGLTLFGIAQMAGAPGDLHLALEDVHWHQDLNCSARKIESEQRGSVLLSLHPAGGFRLAACAVTLDQPFDFFTAEIERLTPEAVRVVVGHAPDRLDRYIAAKHRCRMMIHTNAGVRFVDLGELADPPQVDPLQEHKAVIRHCLKAYSLFWDYQTRPLWQVNPSIGADVVHWWDVTARGLDAGDALLLEADGAIISATAGPAGRAGVDGVFAPSADGISVKRKGSRDAPPELDPRVHGLGIVQTLLALNGRIASAVPFRDVVSVRTRRGALLVAGGASGVSAFDLDRGSPMRVWHSSTPVHCLLSLSGALIAIGDHGLVRWEADHSGTFTLARANPFRVCGNVTVIGDRIVARHNGALAVFDHHLRHLADVEAPPGQILRIGRRLGIRCGDHVALYEVAGHRDAMPCGTVPLTAISLAPGPRVGSTRGARLAQEKRIEWASDGWMDAALRVDRHRIARVTRGGRAISVYSIAGRATV